MKSLFKNYGSNQLCYSPLSVPKPASWRPKRQGTTTAGDTAANTNPSINPLQNKIREITTFIWMFKKNSSNYHIHSKSRRKCDATATVNVSTKQGVNASRNTIPVNRRINIAISYNNTNWIWIEFSNGVLKNQDFE